MPPKNHFKHQEYCAEPKNKRFELLQAPPPIASDDPQFRPRMLAVGEQLRRAKVAVIYLIHGTFVGRDALGWFNEIARVWPAIGELLKEQQKRVLDAVVQEVGNYTSQYGQEFEAAINEDGKSKIPVRLFHWSGENHHLGRADGAIRLIAELRKVALDFPQGRILLWGHSHAGNVFALITNLLASDAATRAQFFEAARSYYRWPLLNITDIHVWREVKELFELNEKPLHPVALDFVTFGTPIRYGWDSNGYGQLLHFVAHRPDPARVAHCATFPPNVDDVRYGRGGDYVQQMGIAGTNFLPNFLAWRDLLADQRLNQFLQPNLPPHGLLDRLKIGMRIPEEGETLLVDYGPMSGSVYEHVAGHAVYTKLHWLLFHAEQVSARFYPWSPDLGS